MNWIADIVIGILALIGTLGGAYLSNKKSAALMDYRLQQLERKVDLHNQVIDRTYQLEARAKVLEEKDSEMERRLTDLEKK